MRRFKHATTITELLTLVAVLVGFLGDNANAEGLYSGKELADQYGCLYCHKIDEKKDGPAYREIAVKYKGDEQAMAELMNSVKSGSRGKWAGANVMLPHKKNLPDADLNIIVSWILSLSQ